MNRTVPSFVAAFVCFFAAFSTHAQLQIGTPIIEMASAQPHGFQLGNFDGDDEPDIAWWSGSETKLHIIYDGETSGYHDEVYELEANPSYGIRHGDFDGDGKDEFAMLFSPVSSDTYSKFVLQLVKPGSTTSTVVVATMEYDGWANVQMTVSDYDSDNDLDIILVDYKYDTEEYSTRVFENKGSFSFAESSPEQLNDILRTQNYILNGDINTIGGKDFLLAENLGTSIKVYIKDEDDYILKSNITTENRIGSIDLFDVDDDFFPDIVMLSTDPVKALTIYRNKGDGTFYDPENYFDDIYTPFFMSHADYDHDGKEDIAIGNFGSPSLVVLHNTGSGFEEQSPESTIGNNSSAIEFIDIDGDGDDEIIEFNSASLSIYRYNGERFIIDRREVLNNQFLGGNFVDLNDDGYPDLVGNSAGMGVVPIFYSKGNFEFYNPEYIKPLTDINPGNTTTGDFNGDGRPDIIYYGMARGKNEEIKHSELSIILSEGSSGFADPQQIDSFNPAKMAVADFDKDDKLDFIGINVFMKGDGTGLFERKSVSTPQMWDNAPGDFNNDGFIDLLAVDGGSAYVAFNSSNVANLFPTFTKIYTGSGLYRCRAGFINGDDKLDFIASNYSGRKLYVSINNGDGTFTNSEINYSHTEGGFGGVPEIKDVNEDGINDIIAPIYRYPNIAVGIEVYNQKPNGEFELYDAFDSGNPNLSTALAVWVNDLNGDQKLDIIVTTADNSSTLVIFPGTSQPTQAPTNLTVSDITAMSATISLSKGNGNGRIIIIHRGGTPDVAPVDNEYIEATLDVGYHFGDIEDTDLIGLTPDTEYIVTAYELFYQDDSHIDYFTDERAETSFTTAKAGLINGLEDPLQQISFYPNPAKNTVNVKSDNDVTVSLIDVLGRRQLSAYGSTIDVSHLSRGTYIIEITTANGTIRNRILLE